MAIIIKVNENVRHPLPAVAVGRASAFEALIVGVPGECENVQIAFGARGDVSTNAVACSPAPGGEWKAYASGVYFPAEGANHYHVTARSPRGDSVYLGGGRLTVAPSTLNVASPEVPIVPNDCYLRNPVTGKWHLLTVTVEDGVLTPIIADEGITR